MLYVHERSPFPRDEIGLDSHLSPYEIFDEDGLLPEEYEFLFPEAMIPVAWEVDVEELAVEEGEEVIWLYVQQTDEEEEEKEEEEKEEEEDEEEENLAGFMEDCDSIPNVEENNDDDDVYYECTGTGDDHTYGCSHEETREAAVHANTENENKNQEMEDNSNLN